MHKQRKCASNRCTSKRSQAPTRSFVKANMANAATASKSAWLCLVQQLCRPCGGCAGWLNRHKGRNLLHAPEREA